MHLRTASYFVALSTVFLVSGAFGNPAVAAPASQPADEALMLAPPGDKPDEATVSSLADCAWELRGPINILGAGFVETLQFARLPDKSLQVTKTQHRIVGFNARDKAVPDQIATDRCSIAGVVLAYGQERQSFVVLKNEALVLNALAPLGKGKWYYTARIAGKPGHPGLQEEYLFDFGDDPCKMDNGKAILQIRQNGFPPKAFKVHFALTTASADCRYFDVLTDGAHAACLARIGIRKDGAYGLMMERPNLDTRVFQAVAAKGVKPATQGAEPKEAR